MAEPTDLPTRDELAPLPPRDRLIRILRGVMAQPEENAEVFPLLADFILEQCAEGIPASVRAELEAALVDSRSNHNTQAAYAELTARIERLLETTP